MKTSDEWFEEYLSDTVAQRSGITFGKWLIEKLNEAMVLIENFVNVDI